MSGSDVQRIYTLGHQTLLTSTSFVPLQATCIILASSALPIQATFIILALTCWLSNGAI